MVVNTIGVPATIDGPAAPLSAMAAPPAVRDAERAATAPIASISIVIPVFNEEGNLRELHRRLSDNLAAIGLPYEVVFVDDGSRDGTWATIRELADGDPHLVAIRHRRNFGKARALASGFAAARGDAVVTMDGDLQDDPDELARFVETLNDGYDVVSGWKQHRQDPLGKTFPSRIFNASVRRVSGVPLHDFNCGYKAYRLHVVRNDPHLRRAAPLHAGPGVWRRIQRRRIAGAASPAHLGHVEIWLVAVDQRLFRPADGDVSDAVPAAADASLRSPRIDRAGDRRRRSASS